MAQSWMNSARDLDSWPRGGWLEESYIIRGHQCRVQAQMPSLKIFARERKFHDTGHAGLYVKRAVASRLDWLVNSWGVSIEGVAIGRGGMADEEALEGGDLKLETAYRLGLSPVRSPGEALCHRPVVEVHVESSRGKGRR